MKSGKLTILILLTLVWWTFGSTVHDDTSRIASTDAATRSYVSDVRTR